MLERVQWSTTQQANAACPTSRSAPQRPPGLRTCSAAQPLTHSSQPSAGPLGHAASRLACSALRPLVLATLCRVTRPCGLSSRLLGPAASRLVCSALRPLVSSAPSRQLTRQPLWRRPRGHWCRPLGHWCRPLGHLSACSYRALSDVNDAGLSRPAGRGEDTGALRRRPRGACARSWSRTAAGAMAVRANPLVR